MLRRFQLAWVSALLLLIPLQDTRPGGAQAAYDYARKLLEHGKLSESQQEAEEGYKQFQAFGPEWAAKFQLLEAEAMVVRGMYDDATRILNVYPALGTSEEEVRKLAIEGVIQTHQQNLSAADWSLTQAEGICKRADFPACGDVLRARGTLAAKRGEFAAAQHYYLDTVAFAKSHGDRFLEANRLLESGICSYAD